MLVHVLLLHLALAAPTVTVLPPLELDGAPLALAQAEPMEPSAPAPEVTLARPHPSTGRAFGAALAGTLGSDLVFGGIFAIGMFGAFSDGILEGDGNQSAAWGVLGLVGATGFVFVTPGVSVWAAQRAVGRERFLAAYAAVFAVRALGFLAAAAFPPVLIATELVLAPYVAARLVAGGRSPAAPVTPGPPDLGPAPGSGPGGPPISRGICVDAAFALR